ncbi:procyclic form-specific polypeptide B-alpha [Drosophila simulans]|uniref:GD23367 n=1 Tax=Drosophila simulans TaxID=7240 RepID=B4Q434_DROSI|nr:procyclic form-specific polypeptide B-alpha [Drosophila simulans]EDX03867.1 GD23367 [Drosophila simulans]KMY88393.1 uncharacterized protein Dsimw501_GD23367 [Drosophila simulans]
MKFLTVFAFACVATFVVLHGAYGSPLPEPVPDPSPVADPSPSADPSPVADPKPVAEPSANPEPATNARAEPGPRSKPNPSPLAAATLLEANKQDNLAIPLLEAAHPKLDDVQGDAQPA